MIIPGQSLTATPKNAPYENPPQFTKPEEALDFHLDRLSEKDRVEALLDAMELGVDVVTLTEGILRSAVMDGRHSVDISLIIAPIVHEFIKGSADKAGIDYDEGFPDDSEKRKQVRYMVDTKKAQKLLAAYEKTGDVEAGSIEEAPIPAEEPMKPAASKMMEEEQPKAKGLMARMSKLTEGM